MELLDSILNPGTVQTTQPQTQPAPQTEPQAQPQTEPKTEPKPEPQTEPQTEPKTEPQTQTEPEEDVDPEEIFTGKRAKGDKQTKAFAEMRVKNASLERTIKSMAQILGVTDVDNEDMLINGLQRKVLEYRSQAEKVPIEALQEVEEARQIKEQFKVESLKQQATLGFQKVKDTYGLTNKQLTSFAEALRDKGLDPFKAPVDLLTEYRTVNFDKILKDAQDKAVAEALARQQKAQTQSTTPVSAQGAPTSGVSKEGGMVALNAVLDKLK
jgi:hypothetical protein